jgi:hypothetical protein
MAIKRNPIDFTIGADPEFLVLDGNKIIGEPQKEGEFSVDGINNKIHEVRPKYSLNPLEVTNSINQIFLNKVKKEPIFGKYSWQCGSYLHKKPLGGHIWFAVTDKIIKPQDACYYLDNYLSSLLMLLEDKEQGIKRRNCEAESENINGEYLYGAKGDFRTSNWGFETRTPASFIHSPKITNGAYCLAKTILFEALNNPKFDGNEYLDYDDFQNMNQDKVKKNFTLIRGEIVQMSLYKNYKKHIDYLFKLIKENKTCFSNKSMKEEWGLIKEVKEKILKPININPVKKIVKPVPPKPLKTMTFDDNYNFEEIWTNNLAKI